MAPPDMLDEAASPQPTDSLWPEDASSDEGLRVELVHRHLAARLCVAEEQMQLLEDQSMAPEALVARFQTTITEAQRTLAAERAEVAEAAEARRRAAQAAAAELVARAAHEARAIREVAAVLRSTIPAPRVGGSALSLPDLDLTVEAPAT